MQKNITKKAKLQLDTAQDFTGLGIVCAEKDYRFCFKLNKALHWNLEKNALLHVHRQAEKITSDVNAYIYRPREMPCTLYIVKNRQDDFFVMPKLKQADFILLANPGPPEPYITDLKNALNSLPIIQSTFAIPNLQLANIDVE